MTPAESAPSAAPPTDLSPDDLASVTGGMYPVSAIAAGGGAGWTFHRAPMPEQPRPAAPAGSRHEPPAPAPVPHPTSRTLNVRI